MVDQHFCLAGVGKRGAGLLQFATQCEVHTSQDPPCALNWGFLVSNNGYLGPNRG